jgi:hypothetical protein
MKERKTAGWCGVKLLADSSKWAATPLFGERSIELNPAIESKAVFGSKI